LSNPDYELILNITKKISQTIPVLEDVKDSHDLVAFYMLYMNHVCAQKLKNAKTGIFRNKKIAHFSSKLLDKEDKEFIESWNGEAAKYTLYENHSTHDLIMGGIDCYTHITSPIRRIIDLLNMTTLLEITGLIQFKNNAHVYLESQYININLINENMKKISKIQSDCALLNYIINNEPGFINT